MGLCQSKKNGLQLQAFPYRHVLITGASSGIGAAVAVQLAGVPGIVLTLVARNQERLETIRAACKAHGAKVRVILADVQHRAAMEDLMQQVHQSSPLELVIANAGIAAQPQSQNHLTDRMLEAAETNILGTLNTIMPAIKLLKHNTASGRPAAVALMSSVSAMPAKSVSFSGHLQLGLLPYAWSKQSLLQLGQGLEAELAGTGVAVYTICPGVVMTDLAMNWASFFMGSNPPNSSIGSDPNNHTTVTQTADANTANGDSIVDRDTAAEDAALSAAETAATHADIVTEQQTQESDHSPVVTVGVISQNQTGGKAVQRKGTVLDPDANLSDPINDVGSSTAKSASVCPSVCNNAAVESELRKQLGAMSPDEAAAEICKGLASGKGGLIAFPNKSVRRMKLMEKIPEKYLVKVIKKAMAKYKV